MYFCIKAYQYRKKHKYTSFKRAFAEKAFCFIDRSEFHNSFSIRWFANRAKKDVINDGKLGISQFETLKDRIQEIMTNTQRENCATKDGKRFPF